MALRFSNLHEGLGVSRCSRIDIEGASVILVPGLRVHQVSRAQYVSMDIGPATIDLVVDLHCVIRRRHLDSLDCLFDSGGIVRG